MRKKKIPDGNGDVEEDGEENGAGRGGGEGKGKERGREEGQRVRLQIWMFFFFWILATFWSY